MKTNWRSSMPTSLAFLLTCLMALPAVAQAPAPDTWVADPAGTIPISISNGSTTDGTFIYINDSQKNFGRFDPATGIWTPLKSLPYQIAYNKLVHVGNAIYSFGSITYPPLPTGGGAPPDPIARYSFADDTWTTLPVALTRHGRYAPAVLMNGKVYISGGFTNTGTGRTDAFSVFDPATETLTTKANLPLKLQYHASTAMPSTGKIYVFGGRTDGPADSYSESPATFEYSVATDTWVQRHDITVDGATVPRLWGMALTANGRIFLAGGMAMDEETGKVVAKATCLEYRPMENDWLRRADLTRPRAWGGSFTIGGQGHLYGGFDAVTGSDISTSREHYVPPPPPGPPPAPTVLIQSSDPNGSPAPVGTTEADGIMSLRATIAPQDSSTAKLQVEVKPLATVFDGSGLIESAMRSTAGVAEVTTPHLPIGSYHWRARAMGPGQPTGESSGWVEYDPAPAADFVVVNTAPHMGGAPRLRAVNGNRAVAPGQPFLFDPQGFRLEAEFSDPDPESVALEIELRPFGVALSGVPTHAGAFGQGGTIHVDLTAGPGSYRLRARVRDEFGNVDAWQSLAGSSATGADLVVLPAGSEGVASCAQSAGPGSPLLLIALLVVAGAGRLFRD